SGNAADNRLIGNDGNNLMDGGSGADTMAGGVGNDTYLVNSADDVVIERLNEGTDSVQSSISYTLTDNVENLTLTGTALDGTGNALNNVITGNAGNNTLDGGAGADTLAGSMGDDSYLVDSTSDIVIEQANAGTDSVFATASFVLSDNLENLTLTGSADINGAGNALDNLITGNAGNNALSGGAGDDVLDGGAGADTLAGGLGNDSYLVDNSADSVIEQAGAGTDGVFATASFTLSDNLENLTLTGVDNIDGTGNALDNRIVGNSGANVLDGGLGADVINGGAGNDTLIGGAGNDALDGGVGDDLMSGGTGNDGYFVDSAGDVTTEATDAGHDTVYASVTHTLAGAVEDLYLGGVNAINGTGNDLANLIVGNAAANVLSGLGGDDRLDGGGGYGNDTLIGGTGNDSYVVDSTADAVVENVNEGIDSVDSSATFTLAANVENLRLMGDFRDRGFVRALDGTGNELDNQIVGNDGRNNLQGLGGNDVIDGRAGDDQIDGGTGNDRLYGGDDAIYRGISEFSEVGPGEMLASNNDILFGGAGDDTIDGGSGNDALHGDDGDDVLYGGNDGLIISSGRFRFLSNNDFLDGGAGKDTLDGGSGNDTLLGGDGADHLIGGADGLLNTFNNDYLDGGAGIDLMEGGTGSDVYLVDGYYQKASGGTGTGGAGSGGEDDHHDGKTEGQHADSGSGDGDHEQHASCDDDHTDSGGSDHKDDDGEDDCCFDATVPGSVRNGQIAVTDLVVEKPNEGYDIVYASIDYTLTSNTEELHLTGAAIYGGGNGLDNFIYGNDANNVLDGGSGSDVMAGGMGDDIYVVDNAGDVIIENAVEGNDTVYSSINYALGNTLENLQLVGSGDLSVTGNAADNVLKGNNGNNLLDGGAGADIMQGGFGNDTYMVDNAGDQVIECEDAGMDTVMSSVTFKLGRNVENLTLTGSAAIDGYGNEEDNILVGNTAANWLDGGKGRDTLYGGAGDDTYVLGQGDDEENGELVVEYAGEGVDTVRSDISYTLGANLENLVLTGKGKNATGNELANVLTGNSANNTLKGNAGDDTLDGGSGADKLIGGTGNDIYLLGRGYGADTIQENDASAGNTDVAQFLTGIAVDQLWFRHVNKDLEVSVIGGNGGSSDKFILQDWYKGSAYHVEQFKTADNRLLLDTQVENLVQAMAAFAPPAAGQSTLPQNYRDALAPVIAANWH
ncbi:MAG: hypothetical protein HY066_07755, partial [Betaproteobacteria bacterium]|nr:hypothetical protein [Betaproteobacteria bacterium]